MAFIQQSSGTSGGNFSIPEVTSDPISPATNSAWVLRTGGGTGGTPIGLLLALTVATGGGTTTYQFSYKTISGSIVRTTLT